MGNLQFLNLVLGVWITILLTRSRLFGWYRNILSVNKYTEYFSECALCVGSWIGFLFFTEALLMGTPTEGLLYYTPSISLYSYLVSLFIDKWETDIYKNQG